MQCGNGTPLITYESVAQLPYYTFSGTNYVQSLYRTACIFVSHQQHVKKVNLSCYMPSRHRGEVALPIIILGTRRVWVVSAMPQQLYPQERDSARIVQAAGWASGPVWMGLENLSTACRTTKITT
jgi:hypothetical protein